MVFSLIIASTSPYKGIKKKLAPMMNVTQENHLHATPVRFLYFFFVLTIF